MENGETSMYNHMDFRAAAYLVSQTIIDKESVIDGTPFWRIDI